jgi:hydrogenase maturation protease
VSDPRGPVLVLGIGNTLMGDEGVGVRVVRELASAADGLPEDARLMDGGTLGLDLLPFLEDARAVLFIDAMEAGATPGSVFVLRGAELEARLNGKLSAHQVGVGDLVAVARLRGTLPRHTSFVGVQPAEVDVGLDLSGPVAAALPELMQTSRAEIAALASADPAA